MNVDEVYGIDIDENRLKISLPCPVTTIKADITQPLNLLDKKFDLITCLGVIEHLWDWDSLFRNVNALSKRGSYLLLSAPNLGSWINRVALILGYKPRDLEISSRKLYYVLPFYENHAPIGHVKLAMYGAMKEFLEDNGFRIVKAVSLYAKDSKIANVIDLMLKFRPSLARRYAILAQKILWWESL